MGLFQRNPFNQDVPLYEISGLQTSSNALGIKAMLIVGLGNVGDQYNDTRHNIGFRALDYFAEHNGFEGWSTSKSRHCQETSLDIGGIKVILCKPTTFMNESGQAIRAMQDFYKINNVATLVVHDDLDINFGQIRIRHGGSDGGNNGIKSVTQHCGDDYKRVRIGIGPKKPVQIDSADFVLGKFTKTQEKNMKMLLMEANSIISEYTHNKAQLPSETRQFLI